MSVPAPCRYLWGDLTLFEAKKFGILAVVFFSVIGSYWLLRPLKDGVFYTLVGLEYLPFAKMLSFIVIIPLILAYTKLVDHFPRHKLIYIICTAYATLFGVVAFLLALPTVGITNTESSPTRVLGWIQYFGVESFGSITVALFWSFVASTTSSTSAKRGYALIVTGGQIGSILGPTLATLTEYVSIPTLFTMATSEILLVVVLIRFYMASVGEQEEEMQRNPQPSGHAEAEEKAKAKAKALTIETERPVSEEYDANDVDEESEVNKEAQQQAPVTESSASKSHSHQQRSTPGVLVGLKLLFTQKYLLGIFVLSTIYEVVGTIQDYQMKMLAKEQFTTTEAYTSFVASFGVATNVLSFTMALLGTSFLLRRLGLRMCLLIYPFAVGVSLISVFLYPSLTVIYLAQVALKGLSYALNNPSKEMLYLPTSPDVKFKVKSWIDMFGGRSAKAFGAMIVTPMKDSLATLLYFGSLVGLACVSFWLLCAFYVGRVFTVLNDEKESQAKTVTIIESE